MFVEQDEGVTVSMKTDDSCCQPAAEVVRGQFDDGRLFFIFLLNAP